MSFTSEAYHRIWARTTRLDGIGYHLALKDSQTLLNCIATCTRHRYGIDIRIHDTDHRRIVLDQCSLTSTDLSGIDRSGLLNDSRCALDSVSHRLNHVTAIIFYVTTSVAIGAFKMLPVQSYSSYLDHFLTCSFFCHRKICRLFFLPSLYLSTVLRILIPFTLKIKK